MNDALLLAALRELGDCLSAVDVPAGVVETFPSLSELQVKFFTTVLEKDPTAIAGAPDCVMRLQPTDLLLECLAAARAKEWPRFIVLVHDALSGDRRSIPDMKQGLADLREVFRLAEELDPDILVELGQLIRSGTPLLAAHIDPVSASSTADVVVLYKVTDQVDAYLAALRAKARNGGVGKIIGGCDHDRPPDREGPV